MRGLSRKFWIVGAATVTVCAALAARAAGEVASARYLTDAPRAPTLPRVEQAPAPPVPSAPAPGNAALLVERNMFCSDCVGAGDPEPSVGGAIASNLPLVLVATSLGREPWATIRNTETGAQGAFGVGDRIPRVGPIERIAGTFIEVVNDGAGRVERIELLAAAPAATGAPKPPVAAKAADGAKANPYADRVRKIDDHTYEVDRQLVRDLVSGGKVDGVAIRPVTQGDKLLGIKVVRASPTSVAAAIGLRPGDMIEGIDGAHIDSAQQLVDMLARLDEVHKVRLDGTRKGGALGLDLHLR